MSKTKKSTQVATEKKDEEITLDLRKLTASFKKFSKYLPFLLLIIPLVLSIFLRTMPERMEIVDTYARNGIMNNIRNNIASNVDKQYPNLPQQNKDAIINEQLNQFLNEQAAQIDAAVTVQADQIRSHFKDESGTAYLGDIDSYFWLRYARNIIEKGHLGDIVKEGRQYDTHMVAPFGKTAELNLYPYLEAYIYRFLSFFNPKASLLQAGLYTPLFLSFFAIIAAFLIGKRISGDLAGFLASMLVAVNPIALSRSLGSDNDIVNLVFPLIIMLFTILAFDSNTIKKKTIFGILSGIFVGVYSFAWSGWWFLFIFIILAALVYIGYLLAYDIFNTTKLKKSKQEIVNGLVFLGIFFVATYIGLFMVGNNSGFFSVFANPLDIISIKSASKVDSIWPNVYTTVAELNEASLSDIVSSVGGKIFFWLALVGTLFSLVKFDHKNKHITQIYLAFSVLYLFALVQIASTGNINLYFLMFLLAVPLGAGLLLSIIYNYKLDPRHSVIITLWFIATIYAATKGVRFTLLIVPAFIISFSSFLGDFVKKMTKYLSKALDIHEAIPYWILVLISMLVLIQPVTSGYNTAFSYMPSINDGWVNTLESIKADSQENAIINSWWDFGHWFKYWADRPVTFDGASQNRQQAHWIGKVLLTEDEDQAIAILRMLDCGGNNAELEIQKITNDSYKTVTLLYELLGMTEEDARTELLKIADDEETDKILSYMYCEPPENYFITSQDMVGKSGVWAHFGIWDFQKAEIYNFFRESDTIEEFNSKMETFGFSQEESTKTYYELLAKTDDREINDWIANWPSYSADSMNTCTNNSGYVVCNHGQLVGQTAQYNIVAETSRINLTENKVELTLGYYDRSTNNKVGEGKAIPEALVVAGSEGYREYSQENITIGQNILYSEIRNNAMLVTPELSKSMFTRLFYMEGYGAEHFIKFYDVIDVTGSRIITWKISWPELK